MFFVSSLRSKGNQSKAESRISAIEQCRSMYEENIRELEDNLSKVTAEIGILKNKWKRKPDVLRIQHKAQSPFWADSKDKMKALLKKQSEIEFKIKEEKQTLSEINDPLHIGLSLLIEASIMKQLARAGSFKAVINNEDLSENDEVQSDMSSLSDEDMCFPMDHV